MGISVSRVGGNAQIKAMKKIAGTLKLDQAQYRELEAFSKFGSDLDAATKRVLAKGARNTEILKQGQYKPVKVEHQIAIIFCGVEDLVSEIPLNKIGAFEKAFIERLELNHPSTLNELKEGILSDETRSLLTKVVEEVAVNFK